MRGIDGSSSAATAGLEVAPVERGFSGRRAGFIPPAVWTSGSGGTSPRGSAGFVAETNKDEGAALSRTAFAPKPLFRGTFLRGVLVLSGFIRPIDREQRARTE